MVLALRTSATMVSGWDVFGLAPSRERSESRSEVPAATPDRTIAPTASRTPAFAATQAERTGQNRTSLETATASVRTTRTVVAHPGSAPVTTGVPPLRTHGLGSRWRRSGTAEILR